MQKTFVETFAQADFTEDHIKQLCAERKQIPGCVSSTYKADGSNWVITTIVNMLQ